CTAACSPGQLPDDVRLAAIVNGVHRIEPQTVDVVFLEPIERVVNEEVAHHGAARAIEVDGCAPRSLVARIEELRSVEVQVVTFGAKVVVDHIEYYSESLAMGGGYQRLELVRAAIGGLRSVRQRPVVTPVAQAGKGADRHELDGGHTEPFEVAKARGHRAVGARSVEGTHVQLVDDGAVPGGRAP